MVNFIAKRRIGQLALFADGFQIGTLNDCESCWIFEGAGNDEVMEQHIADALEGDMSITEMLAEVRRVYTGFAQMYADECVAEAHAEGAWLRAAEYDAEAQHEMEMEDGKS